MLLGLLASMADQLASGNEQLRRLIAPLLAPDIHDQSTEELSQEELLSIASTYEGWRA